MSSSLRCGDEMMWKVSANIMNHPLAFVVDCSSSLIKLAFRSKKDYRDGKPLQLMEHGILRFQAFKVEEDFVELFDFMDDNVDITLTEEHTSVEWRMAGEDKLQFKDQLERRFKIKTKMFPEHLFAKIIVDNYKDLDIDMHPASLESVKMAANISENLMTVGGKRLLQVSNQTSNGDNYLTQLISTNNYEAWVDKYLGHTSTISTPTLIFQAASAGLVYKIDEHFEIKHIEHLSICGKTLTALCEELFGEKDFGKIMELAESGDAQKVNVYGKDIKSQNKQERNSYNFRDMDLIWELGKISSYAIRGKGDYTKADLAAGVLSLMVRMMAKEIILLALFFQVDRVYVFGWLFEASYNRTLFQKLLLTESFAAFLPKGKPPNVHFFKESEALTSKAVWMQNVTEEKNRKLTKSKFEKENI